MVSCVRDVEIDLEDLPDRIVLNASVCPGKEVCAHLSKTWFIMDSVPDFELSDAKVRVYVNDEFQGFMRWIPYPIDLLPTMPNICVSLLKSGLRRIPIIV